MPWHPPISVVPTKLFLPHFVPSPITAFAHHNSCHRCILPVNLQVVIQLQPFITSYNVVPKKESFLPTEKITHKRESFLPSLMFVALTPPQFLHVFLAYLFCMASLPRLLFSNTTRSLRELRISSFQRLNQLTLQNTWSDYP
ncbi:hypothetical protein CIPAW_09G186100 [Carya illinoinensis]|uniref:Uncharacterized protein n=1 Tax=Carya illinoinensis TaxID=32201 RepID=A0A8T1PPZ6_CARIL|nr:hypothetical protein CIPAW_09G186100 [Carya illinoinensis]